MTRRRLLIAALTLLVTLIASPVWAADVIDPVPFDAVLKEFVDRQGRVSYAKLHGDTAARAKLAAYNHAVGRASLEGASREAKLAFYINAYNAAVLQSVLEEWPAESVMKIDGFFKKKRHRIAGKAMTLDALENTIIRPQFKDARVHFVLVCAAKSCPPLRSKALTEANLGDELARATRQFVSASTRADGEKVRASKLFSWFADDFKRDEGSVSAYLAKYADDDALKSLLSKGGAIAFDEYDWALNAK